MCSVYRGVFSTSGGYHEYIGGISWVHLGRSVHRGDTMSTSGDVQNIGDIMMHVGGTVSTSRDVQYVGGYHEHIGKISWCMWGSKLIKAFQFLLKAPMYWTSPNVLMISPRCIEHPPMYSWYIPDVLMISPDVLMVSPQCTEHALYRVVTETEQKASTARVCQIRRYLNW